MMDLPHLAARLFGAPLMVAPRKLDAVVAAVGPRLLGIGPAPRAFDDDGDVGIDGADRYHRLIGSVAVLPIVGALVTRGSWIGAMSGLVSYDEIGRAARSAFADPGAEAVLLELDTPGGEVGGIFDLARDLRRMADDSGKPFWAVASHAALSAGYVIAAPADQIWVTDTGEAGSIGVVAVHVDQSAADRREGLAYSFIHAGAHKVDGHPHAPLSDAVRADLQDDIDGLYDRFVALVAGRRGMSEADIRATEARIYRGADAVTAGLADAVGTLDEAVAALAAAERPSPYRTGGKAARRAAGSHGSKGMRIKAKGRRAEDDEREDEEARGKGRRAEDEERDDEEDPPSGRKGRRAAEDEDDREDEESSDRKGGASRRTAEDEEGDDDRAGRKGRRAADDEDDEDPAAIVRRERARAAEIEEIATQAGRLGVRVDAAAAIRDGTSPSALRTRVLDRAAKRDRAESVVTAAATDEHRRSAQAPAPRRSRI